MIAAFIARVGWANILKVALPPLMGAILISFVWWGWTVFDRTRIERDRTVAELTDFRRAVTDATVPAGADGTRPLLSVADARSALAAVVRDRDDARASLTRIDRDTKAAKARADQADAALVVAQAANRKRFGAAQDRIVALEAARPAADAAANEAAIDDDSKAAWESWR